MHLRSVLALGLFAFAAPTALADDPALSLPPPPPTPSEAVSPPPATVAPGTPTLLRRGKKGAPDQYRYRGGAVPEGYRLVEQPNWTMFGMGVTVFSIGHGLMVLAAVNTLNPLYAIPFVGPLFTVTGGSSYGFLPFLPRLVGFVSTVVALLDIVAQVGGVVLGVLAFTQRERWLERSAPATPQVVLVPGAAGALAGVSLVGRF